MIISPSILSANMLNLAADIEMINKSKAQWVHLDIMDGRFVPNISFGIPVVKAVRKATDKILDVHLMIVEPEKYFAAFADAGADLISFHVEATNHVHRCIYQIKEMGKKVGIVLNPHTPLVSIKEVLIDVDLVLLMSVNPGFGGQQFIKNTYSKVRELNEMIRIFNSSAIIQVDGGVNLENAQDLANDGATCLVAGNSVFGSPNPIEVINKMEAIKDESINI